MRLRAGQAGGHTQTILVARHTVGHCSTAHRAVSVVENVKVVGTVRTAGTTHAVGGADGAFCYTSGTGGAGGGAGEEEAGVAVSADGAGGAVEAVGVDAGAEGAGVGVDVVGGSAGERPCCVAGHPICVDARTAVTGSRIISVAADTDCGVNPRCALGPSGVDLAAGKALVCVEVVAGDAAVSEEAGAAGGEEGVGGVAGGAVAAVQVVASNAGGGVEGVGASDPKMVYF